MFNNSKYTKWYWTIIKHAQQRTIITDYFESHHIVPKSIGGTHKAENRVMLTAREHYIAHLLLQKMVDDKRSKFKMATAFMYLNNTKKKYTQRYTSRLYDYHKKIHSRVRSERMAGENNPMFGKQHAKATLAKISKAKLGVSTLSEDGRERKSSFMKNKENNPNYNPAAVAKSVKKRAKWYIVIDPNGTEYTTKNMAQHCKVNGLDKSMMAKVAKGKRDNHKGWKCSYLNINNNN